MKISGTPGTGKTTLATELAQNVNFEHINIGQLAKEENFYEGYDEQYECPILSEDQARFVFIYNIDIVKGIPKIFKLT